MQTTYSSAMAKGLPGMLADLNRNKHVESHVNGEASAEIPFGVVVAKHATIDAKVILPADADAVLLGVALRSDSYAPTYDLGDDGIKPKVPVSVLTSGMVYMFPEGTVAKNDPVYVRHTASGGNTQKGAVSNAAGTGLMLWRGARWMEGGTAGVATKMEIFGMLPVAVGGLAEEE